MKISEITGRDAIEVMADILDPITKIMADEAISNAFKHKTRIEAISLMLKSYADEVIIILARLDNADPKDYEVKLTTLPRKLIELLEDPDINDLFTSQAQNEEQDSFGSATESIEETED